MTFHHRRAPFVAMLAALMLVGCVDGSTSTSTPTDSATSSPAVDAFRQELHDELVEMQAADQFERTGEGSPPGTKLPPIDDYGRAERLKQIIEEAGWPTFDMVGRDGATAAWLVAQHADHDVEFQRVAVSLLTDAVADGQGDPAELAYLVDRLAVNEGRPQRYGTQVRCRNGAAEPATPLLDGDGVDAARESVGLGPLADYHDEFALPCADEAAEGLDLRD